MKAVRYLLAGVILLIAGPFSWAGAWVAGSGFTFVLSLILPTYGGIYWGLLKVLEHGLLHSLLSWILGFGGAFVTYTAIHNLVKDPV